MNTLHPLLRTSIVLTRAAGRSAELAVRLKTLGALIIEKPLIETRPVFKDAIARKLSNRNCYDGIIVTSANAVRAAFAICQHFNLPWVLGDLPWYCIGKATAQAAKTLRMNSVIFEDVRNGQEFARALVSHFQGKEPGKMAFLHGQKADLSFMDELHSAGIDVSAILVYETIDAEVDIHELQHLQNDRIVVYVFYSPSTVKSLLRQWPDFSLSRTDKTFVVTIGRTTSDASTRLGVSVDGVAIRPTTKGVISAIVGLVAKHKANTGGGK